MMNLGITAVSVLLTAIVFGNAFYEKRQFYPSLIYISKSSVSMGVIYLQALSLALLFGRLVKKIFFGELRSVEQENMIERAWDTIPETCLVFAVFKNDFSPKFVFYFVCLFFLKVFHELANDRVNVLERSASVYRLFHVRMVTLLCILVTLDLIFIEDAYNLVRTRGEVMALLFGFEYALLTTSALNTGIKYTLHTIDLMMTSFWESKSMFLLYTKLIMGLLRVILNMILVMVMTQVHILPLFALRRMYYALRSFRRAVNDVIMSKRAINNMRLLYQDATPEDLAAGNMCIICRDEMRTDAKRLPCNHIFHTACLRLWFQRQQTCPICRLSVLNQPSSRRPNYFRRRRAHAHDGRYRMVVGRDQPVGNRSLNDIVNNGLQQTPGNEAALLHAPVQQEMTNNLRVLSSQEIQEVVQRNSALIQARIERNKLMIQARIERNRLLLQARLARLHSITQSSADASTQTDVSLINEVSTDTRDLSNLTTNPAQRCGESSSCTTPGEVENSLEDGNQ